MIQILFKWIANSLKTKIFVLFTLIVYSVLGVLYTLGMTKKKRNKFISLWMGYILKGSVASVVKYKICVEFISRETVKDEKVSKSDSLSKIWFFFLLKLSNNSLPLKSDFYHVMHWLKFFLGVLNHSCLRWAILSLMFSLVLKLFLQ